MSDDLQNSYIRRSSTEYENQSQKFITSTRNYTKQYCSIYVTRLEQMQKVLVEKARNKWGPDFPILKLHKLSESDYDKCVVVGTLFKDQKLKPSIIKQLSEANQLVPQPLLTSFTDDSDTLLIEDELQRYQILGKLKKDNLVTGITCALLGKDIGKGKFEVEDYLFIDFHPQIERPVFEENLYVLFLSGLDLVHLEKTNISLQIIIHWLSGLIHLDDMINSKDICRVIIAGNSVRTIPEKAKPTISMTSRIPESSDTINAVEILDKFVYNLCKVIAVDIMPGENDPSNHILPQQPLHHCMFPNASRFRSFHPVSNPYKCSLGGLRMLGTSGQPIRDIMRFSNLEDPLDALESCLRWSHLAPTAPDTLGCFPFYEEDPFILDDCPHVFFAGNQEKFGTKIAKGSEGQRVCLLSIPEFATTQTACLLNLKTLECHPVSIKS